MTLSMLTTSGWVWFALVMMSAFGFVWRVIAMAKSPTKANQKIVASNAFWLAIGIAWLLWLVTP